MAQIIKRGIIQSFSSATYTASVLLLEATSTFLTGVPISTTVDGTSALSGAFCAILFFDEHNINDAVIIAIYPNGTQGVPTPPPGRVTFTTGNQPITSSAITSGNTNTYTMTGAGGIPAGALGIIYTVGFTSPTVGAGIQVGPHGGDLSKYASFGNLTVANETRNGAGVIPLDSNGKIDIKAGAGNCTVTLNTYGYVV